MNKKTFLLFVSVFTYLFSVVIAKDYSAGFKNAYNYAYEKWITTMDSISKANMNWSITRIEMAKMISEFSINVLWLKPDTTKNCSFYDTSPDIDKQYNYWVTKACQLWLMWIYDDWEKSDYFNPKKSVTRWEWATILSRTIRLSEWKNVIKNGNPFYEPHLKFLLLKWIVNSYDNPSPKSEEIRWNVMLMLYKADPKNTIIVNSATWFVNLKAWEIYRNDYFWIQITSDSKRPWLIAINELYDEYTKSEFYWVSIYNYVEEKIGTLTLDWYLVEDFKETAKQYNVEWLLMPLKILYISEKWWYCDQQWDDDWWLSDFWSFVYKTNNYIIRDSGFWLYQELPFYDSLYDDLQDSYSSANEVTSAIYSLTLNNIYSNLDEFYLKWMPVGATYNLNKRDVQKYENIIREARKEIKTINSNLSNILKENNASNWNTIISQKKKMFNNDIYYNLKYEFKMKRDWSFPWLIADNNSVKYNKWGISIYVFIPEHIWEYYLTDENKKKYSKNAEQFGQSGYLMKVKDYYFDMNDCSWEDLKKWKTKKWYNICSDSSSDYLVFLPRFPYENKKNDSAIEEKATQDYFKNEIWFFPIEVEL